MGRGFLPDILQVSKEPSASPIQPLSSDKLQRKRDQLKKATQDFESVFIGNLLKQMRKSMASENGLIGSSSEAKKWQEMMDDTLANHLSKTGSFGIGKVLYKNLESKLGMEVEAVVSAAPVAPLSPAASTPEAKRLAEIVTRRLEQSTKGGVR